MTAFCFIDIFLILWKFCTNIDHVEPFLWLWWSSQTQLAVSLGSNLNSCLHCTHRESSVGRSVLAPQLECYQRVFFTPQRGTTTTQLLLLFAPFFLHLCHSLRVMQMHTPCPSISILGFFSPAWTCYAWGLAGTGKVEWMQTQRMSSYPHSALLSIVSNHNP